MTAIIVPSCGRDKGDCAYNFGTTTKGARMATSEKNLVLYVKNLCPYCRKVTTYMKQHDIEIPIKDVYSDVDAMVELVTIGGKNQAPCLFIDGKPLYESDDIVAFLAEEFAV